MKKCDACGQLVELEETDIWHSSCPSGPQGPGRLRIVRFCVAPGCDQPAGREGLCAFHFDAGERRIQEQRRIERVADGY